MRIEIEAQTQNSLDLRIEKANKALKKAHLNLVQVVSKETRFKTKKAPSTLDWIAGSKEIQVPYIVATLEIPEALVRVEGQEIVGRIQETPIGNMVTTLKGEDLPEKYRKEALRCDHCKTKRHRKASWIIRKGDQLIQIGDQCASVYFGVDVESILATYEKFSDLLSDEEDWGGSCRRYFEIHTFLNCVAWLTLRGGFVSRKVAESYPDGMGLRDTSSRAQWILWASLDPRDTEGQREQRQARQEFQAWLEENQNEKQSENCLSWWKEKNENEKLVNFEWNVVVSLFTETPKWSGLAAYGMKIFLEKTNAQFKAVDYYRAVRLEVKNEALAPEKTRVEFQGICTEIRDFEEYFLVKVQAETGHLVCWYSSNRPEFKMGDRIVVKATVKATRTYKDQITTQVNRPKILHIIPLEIPY